MSGIRTGPDQTTVADRLAELSGIGLGWSDRGYAAITGPLLRLARECDAAFRSLAARWNAQPEEHASFIATEDLAPVGYLASFPHLATFGVAVKAEPDGLRAFAESARDDASAAPEPESLTAPRDVLTPAACYHVYIHHSGRELTAPLLVTTKNTCFRREAHYEPLRRQWSFRMREIVHVGARQETERFLERTRGMVDELAVRLELPIEWKPASDPFFDPKANPGYLMQKLHPTKYEACYGDLAIASVNMHEDHFGAAYGITHGGRPATSGCVAFGIERWLYALTDRWGTDPDGWPDVRDAAHGSERG
ncbi:MAG TPA: hypothetical protein VGM10_25195 [Actinocrinis sp.]|jgi:hypothetical protein